MKLTVPETQVARLSVNSVEIGQLNAGPLAIGTLVLSDPHLQLGTGAAELMNVRVTVSLKMSLAWRVTVEIPFADDWSWDGVLDLGTKSITVTLGDITCPGLQSLDVDLPSVSMADVSAVLGPLRALKLGPLVAEKIAAQNAELPMAGFQIAGLALGSLQVAGTTVPDGTAARTAIDRVSGEAFPIGTVTIPNLDLPDLAIGDVDSGSVDVDATGNVLHHGADLGVLDVTLSITPEVRVQLDQLRLGNIRSTASLGSLELHDVVLPYEILGLTLEQIGISEIGLPTIEVS